MPGGHLWNDLEPIKNYLLEVYQVITDRAGRRVGELT